MAAIGGEGWFRRDSIPQPPRWLETSVVMADRFGPAPKELSARAILAGDCAVIVQL